MIGSRKAGAVSYNLVMNNGYKQSAQLSKIMREVAIAREFGIRDEYQEVAVQKEVEAADVKAAHAKFAIIQMENYTVVARDLDEATARKNIEQWAMEDSGREYMLVQEVAIVKTRNTVVWSEI